MSIPVALADLAEEMSKYPFAYLLTVSDDGRPHAVAVTPEWVDGALVLDVGRRTTSNAGERPLVSLVFPPFEPGGYSLIVDAAADVETSGVIVAPERAVLHRPAPAGVPGGACGSDCVPVAVPPT